MSKKTYEMLMGNCVVRTALFNCRCYNRRYWQQLIANRLFWVSDHYKKGCYDYESARKMAEAILNTNWEETSSCAIKEGQRVCVGHLMGIRNVARIANLPKNTVFTVKENNGEKYLSVTGVFGEVLNKTYVIIGINAAGIEIIEDFYPGEPVLLTSEAVSKVAVDTQMTFVRAKLLGVDWARIE